MGELFGLCCASGHGPEWTEGERGAIMRQVSAAQRDFASTEVVEIRGPQDGPYVSLDGLDPGSIELSFKVLEVDPMFPFRIGMTDARGQRGQG